jgi:phage replication-related protein YjqB (UPF0714/DUF867 family)
MIILFYNNYQSILVIIQVQSGKGPEVNRFIALVSRLINSQVTDSAACSQRLMDNMPLCAFVPDINKWIGYSFMTTEDGIVDRYINFEHLQRSEQKNADYLIEWRIGSSGIAVMSIHGGNIEPGTTQIADSIAGQEHSFYSFKGVKCQDNLSLHITSTHFDEPTALQIVCFSEIIISIHGCKDLKPVAYVGGLDVEIINQILYELQKSDIHATKCSGSSLGGEGYANICNLCGRGMGIQIEVSRGLRLQMFRDLSQEGRNYHTEMFFRFSKAIRNAIEPYARMYLESSPMQSTD